MNEIIKKETPLKVSANNLADKKEIVKTDAEIDAYIGLRQAFIQKVNAICIEGKDYHIIQGKKSLAKGGAEKIASIFKWTAKFEKDTDALSMLGNQQGLVAFKCTLENGQFVGEGRGASILARNNGDPNKTLKMAQKSAFIDAVLRASGLSDFFTQDLEDMPEQHIQTKRVIQPTPDNPVSKQIGEIKPSEKQLDLIKKLAKEKGITKEDILDAGFGKLTGGKGGTASELIDFLLKADSKLTPNGDPLPVIQQEPITEEQQKIIDGIPF